MTSTQRNHENHGDRCSHHVRTHGSSHIYPADYGKQTGHRSLREANRFLKIVVLVTKAVGDLLGTNGIAEEMIKFNGYPFLEKEDYAFNVPGLPLSPFRGGRSINETNYFA